MATSKANTPSVITPDAVSTVIFDWAGTVLDFGCVAPVAAFRQAFSEQGLDISEAEARAPMGSAKREHIELILAQPDVQQRWRRTHGGPSLAVDVDRLYDAFLRVDAEISAQYSRLIPGTLETIGVLRDQGIAVGSTTGYPRSIMATLAPLAQAQGYSPDFCVTADEVAHGRPWPDMLLANALALNVRDVRTCVVVDDSPSGLIAARAAGMWAVGVSVSGNEVGLSLEGWSALDEAAQARLRQAAEDKLEKAGAHYVIDSITELLPVIQNVSDRLQAGDRP